MAIEVAMLDLDARAFGGLGGEPDLDLAGLVGIGLDLPARVDVPADHHPVGRLAGQDASPVALAAVDAAIVDLAPHARLEDPLGDVDLEQVVLARPPRPDAFGKDRERFRDRSVDDCRGLDRRGCRLAHESSCDRCSAAVLNAAMA